MAEQNKKIERTCPVCLKTFDVLPENEHRITDSPECATILRALSRKFNPSADELWGLVWQQPQTYIARMFGVKSTTLLQRCKKLGVLKPPVGYWRMIETGHSRNDALKHFGWLPETIATLNEKILAPPDDNLPPINYLTDFDWRTVPVKTLKTGLYFRAPDHPLAHKGIALRGLVTLVRHIASVKLGRWIRRGELICYADGNPQNIDPENLLVVNKSKHISKSDEIEVICPVCEKPFMTSAKQPRITNTKECAVIWRRKKFNPTADELRSAVWQHTQTEIARIFGTNDATVRERCKEMGIITPPKGYWTLIRLGWSREDALIHLGWSLEEIDNI